MDRQQILDILREHKPVLEERFGVTELTLFGSFARNQATEDSDVDIIVKFDGPATSKGYFGTLFYLEKLMGRTVDLATHKSLRSEILPFVEKDIVMADEHKLVREWRFYIKDMIQFGEKTLSFTECLDQATFFGDELTYNATLRMIQLVGEAARHIPDDVKEAYPGIPWHEIIGTRNHLVHGYEQVDESTIWDIVQNDIPALLPQLRKLLAEQEQAQS